MQKYLILFATHTRYILQLSLVHRRFVGQRPSFLAKAALILSEEILREKFWLSNDTRLISCVNQLSSILADPPKQLFKKVCILMLICCQKLKNSKFSESKYTSVAVLAKDWFHASRLPGGGPNPTEFSSVFSNPQRSRLQGLLTPPKEFPSPTTSSSLGGSDPPLSSWTIPQPIAPHFSKTNSSMDTSASLLDYTPSGSGTTAIPALISRTMTSTSSSSFATRENSLLMHRKGSCIW